MSTLFANWPVSRFTATYIEAMQLQEACSALPRTRNPLIDETTIRDCIAKDGKDRFGALVELADKICPGEPGGRICKAGYMFDANDLFDGKLAAPKSDTPDFAALERLHERRFAEIAFQHAHTPTMRQPRYGSEQLGDETWNDAVMNATAALPPRPAPRKLMLSEQVEP